MLIEHGIEKHFQQDYISSIHILMPRIEALLRLLLKSKNVIVTQEESHRSIDKLLEGILEMKKLEEIYQPSFIKF